MSSTDNLPRPADSPCLKCASAGCTSITVGKGGDRKTFPGCAIWQQWFSDRWQGYQATAYKMKCLRKAREERKLARTYLLEPIPSAAFFLALPEATSCKATMRQPKPFCTSLTHWTN